MFAKTRRRLVWLNAMVLIIVLGSFGTFLYFYMEYRLDRQVDATLNHMRENIIREQQGDVVKYMDPYSDKDDRTVILFWGDGNALARIMPERRLSEETIDQLLQVKISESARTITIDRCPYRVLTVPVQRLINMNGSAQYIHKIQLVYNLEREHEMLEHLLKFIELGSFLGIAVAILAGFFMANKALVPIQSAWNKQSQFVADASHELRTPLAVMKLNLERLFRHPKNSIEQESENISQAIGEIKYMTKIISDLLTLARSDSNQLEMTLNKVDLTALLNKVTQDFSELAKVKEIHLGSVVDSEPMEIEGDSERLYQLFVIILDNALKYTPPHGTITVESSIKGSSAHIVISDTGEGISKEDLPLIFDRFFRGDKVRTRKNEGTGLGLSIAQWIVKQHGGSVKAMSELGVGTRMTIYLPIIKKRA